MERDRSIANSYWMEANPTRERTGHVLSGILVITKPTKEGFMTNLNQPLTRAREDGRETKRIDGPLPWLRQAEDLSIVIILSPSATTYDYNGQAKEGL